MNYRNAVRRVVFVLACVSVIAGPLYAQTLQVTSSEKGPDTAAGTLRHYLQLRLGNADWKDYSKLITWPDEPSWDCNWVVSNFDIGVTKKRKQNVVIPVVFKRIGLFCYDSDFSPDLKIVTINYELVKRNSSGWKVNGPIPDYPDISAEVLIKSLRASAEDLHESPERRAQFGAAARKLADALKHSDNSQHQSVPIHRNYSDE
jgi:hypothetical protein